MNPLRCTTRPRFHRSLVGPAIIGCCRPSGRLRLGPLFAPPLLLASLLLCTVASSAPKEVPPPGSAPKPFRLPKTEDFRLPNGMRVTIVPYGVVPKVAIRAFVDAGAIDESASQVWLSRLTGLLMKEGTRTRSSSQIAREAAEMGGQLEITPGSDSTSVGVVVLSDFGPQFVAVLADVLRNASLPASELSRLKADLLRNLSVDKSQPGTIADERFFQTLFPNHPYGPPFAIRDRTAGLHH